MSDTDMNAALDALEEEHGIDLDGEQLAPEVIVDDDPAPDPEPEPEQKPKADNPPGYIDNLEDWVAAGKNPDDFKGKNAYTSEYERIKENREMKESLKLIGDSVTEWKSQQQEDTRRQVEQERANVLAEIEEARDKGDIDGALAAKDKLNNLSQNTAPDVQQPNPVITQFYDKNPIVKSGSAEFDQDFYDDMSMAQQAVINQLTGGDPALIGRLTEAQIQRSMNVAYTRTKELHPEKFQSKRNNRQAAPTQQKRVAAKQSDYATKLKGANFKSKHNSRDNNAANDIYEMLKKMDPKAADTYAKNVLGEQS